MAYASPQYRFLYEGIFLYGLYFYIATGEDDASSFARDGFFTPLGNKRQQREKKPLHLIINATANIAI